MSEQPRDPIFATVQDLAWMEGQWCGTLSGDTVEEHWSGPAADSIMGMFRWISDGKVTFYELLAIESEDGRLTMRIKHFHPGLKGWEEKDAAFTLDLTSLEGPRSVWFKRGSGAPLWLIYERIDSQLIARFEKADGVPGKDGPFVYDLLVPSHSRP
jgi:hypothetical protein